MINFGSTKKAMCLILTGLLIVGTPAMANGPAEIRSHDATLSDHGLLSGMVLDPSGQPVEGITVQVIHRDSVVASSTSDAQGRFKIQGLRNGAHTIQAGQHQSQIRLWETATAPPKATSNISIVVDDTVVRGQALLTPVKEGGNRMKGATLGALLLVGGGAAIVLATANDNDTSQAILPASP